MGNEVDQRIRFSTCPCSPPHGVGRLNNRIRLVRGEICAKCNLDTNYGMLNGVLFTCFKLTMQSRGSREGMES